MWIDKFSIISGHVNRLYVKYVDRNAKAIGISIDIPIPGVSVVHITETVLKQYKLLDVKETLC